MAKQRTGVPAEGQGSLDAATAGDVLMRLRRVEGQIQGIGRMIEQGRDCHAIAQQMGAAKAALERATVQLMSSSLVQCLKPGKNGSIDQQEIARLTDTFAKILG